MPYSLTYRNLKTDRSIVFSIWMNFTASPNQSISFINTLSEYDNFIHLPYLIEYRLMQTKKHGNVVREIKMVLSYIIWDKQYDHAFTDNFREAGDPYKNNTKYHV